MENANFGKTSYLLEDEVTESDDKYQNAGEKGILHPQHEDQPRRRAMKKRAWHLVKRPTAYIRDSRSPKRSNPSGSFAQHNTTRSGGVP